MNRQPTKDELRLSATQIAELAACEARFYWRWKRDGKPPSPAVIIDLPPPKQGAPTPEQRAARERGIAEHARFHEQASRFHNVPQASATEPHAPSATAPRPPVIQGGRTDSLLHRFTRQAWDGLRDWLHPGTKENRHDPAAGKPDHSPP